MSQAGASALDGNGRVLVIDDSELVVEILADALADMGWDVHKATSGGEGVDQAQAMDFECVICDMHMPGMSGIDVLDAVQHADDLLPVIILSSDMELATVLNAIRHGAFDYVPKSEMGALMASVERAVLRFRRLRERTRPSRIAAVSARVE